MKTALEEDCDELVKTWEHRAKHQFASRGGTETLMCARDLVRVLIRHRRFATTEPAVPPVSDIVSGAESARPSDLPFMKWPTNLPKDEEEK